MIIAGEQWKGSAICIRVSILPQTPFPSRLLHIIEQSSMCYAICPHWLSILNTAVCTCPSQTPYPSLPIFPPGNHVCSLCLWVPFYFVSSFVSFLFRFHIKGMSCDILPSLSDLLHSVWQSQGFPGGARGKEPTCQCRRYKRDIRFYLWVGKILWRRKWQLTAVLLPEKSHGQRSLVGYSPWGHKESDMTEVT